MAVAATCCVVVALPLFLVGAQAVQIGADLHLGVGGLGLVVAFYSGCTAISTALLGRLAQRQGARWGLLAALLTSGIGMLAIAGVRSTQELALGLAVAGVANGAMHPSANGLLATSRARIPLGLSLGIKQAATPAASIAAGLAVPLVALTMGWRWSFVGGALLSLLVARVTARAVPRSRPLRNSAAPRKRVVGRHQLIILAVAAALATSAGSSVTVFLVDFGVTNVHFAEGTAGVVLAAASLGILIGTLAAGWLADRPGVPDARLVAAGLMLVSSVGYLSIASAAQPAYVAGALIAGALGRAWPPLLHFAVIRAHLGAAARATGVLMSGVAAGSALGPLMLGQVAQHVAYQLIWLLMAGASIGGGALLWLMVRGSTHLERNRAAVAGMRESPVVDGAADGAAASWG